MPEATNQQMQKYADERIRVRAEQVHALLNAIKLDKAEIEDEYSRASGSNASADARTDGPPHLLKAGNSASPDDFLNYNAFISDLITFIETTQSSAWSVLERAIVNAR